LPDDLVQYREDFQQEFSSPDEQNHQTVKISTDDQLFTCSSSIDNTSTNSVVRSIDSTNIILNNCQQNDQFTISSSAHIISDESALSELNGLNSSLLENTNDDKLNIDYTKRNSIDAIYSLEFFTDNYKLYAKLLPVNYNSRC